MLRLHVHVIAVRLPSPGAEKPQATTDLLPWADPYIAALIRRLADEGKEPASDLVADLEADGEDDLWDLLAEDAFVPPEEERLTVLRPVVGGWPLLDAPPQTEHEAAIGCQPTPDAPVRRPR